MQHHAPGFAIIAGFERGDEAKLAGCSTPALAGALAAQIRVIEFHARVQFMPRIPFLHRLHQFVLEFPSGVVS